MELSSYVRKDSELELPENKVLGGGSKYLK
jgi:hypothetical protein